MIKLKKVFLNTAVVCLFPLTAHAYIGPGAGLSLLGALWALILALLTAVAFILIWPLKRILRRNRKSREPEPVHEDVCEAGIDTRPPTRDRLDSDEEK